jgi:hypothetical protein
LLTLSFEVGRLSACYASTLVSINSTRPDDVLLRSSENGQRIYAGCAPVHLTAVSAETGTSSELTGIEDYSEEVYYAAKFP